MNHPCRSSHTFVPRVEHGGTQARALIKPAPITPSRSAYELLEEEERHSPPFGSALPDHVTAFTSTTLTLPPRGRDPANAGADGDGWDPDDDVTLRDVVAIRH